MSRIVLARQSVGGRVWIIVQTNKGVLRTGIGSGSFTATIVDPSDAANTTAAVTESSQKSGLYYFDVPSAFLGTNGVGDYAAVVEVNETSSPKVKTVANFGVKITQEDIDTVAGNAGLTAAETAAAVWGALQSDHLDDGTMGGALLAAAAQGLQYVYEDNFVFGNGTTGPDGQILSVRRRFFEDSDDFDAASDLTADWGDGEKAIWVSTITYQGTPPFAADAEVVSQRSKRVARPWSTLGTVALLLDGDDPSTNNRPIDRSTNALGEYAVGGGAPTYTTPASGLPGRWGFLKGTPDYYTATLAGTDITGPGCVLTLTRPTEIDGNRYFTIEEQPNLIATELTGLEGQLFIRQFGTAAQILTSAATTGDWVATLYGVDGAGNGQIWELFTGTASGVATVAGRTDIIDLTGVSTIGADVGGADPSSIEVAQVVVFDGQDGTDATFRADLLKLIRERWGAL